MGKASTEIQKMDAPTALTCDFVTTCWKCQQEQIFPFDDLPDGVYRFACSSCGATIEIGVLNARKREGEPAMRMLAPEQDCAFCNGKGSIINSTTGNVIRCVVCLGTGRV